MPALLERPKMTRAMYEALKRHIMREREKKKQEQEQDAQMEQLKKERELRKKKEEEDSKTTIENTVEQIKQLEKRLEDLKDQKKELFSQLKKVLNNDETRRKAQQKEHSELQISQPAYPRIPPAAQPIIMHGRPALYKASTAPIMTIKRTRSPTPPPSSSTASYSNYGHSEAKYAHTSDSKYPHSDAKYSSHADTKFGHTDPKYLASYAGAKGAPPSHLYTAQHAQSQDFKSSGYPQASANQLYAANPSFQQQTATGSYTSGQSATSKYPGAGQSAFRSFPSHYTQSHPQKVLTEPFPASYPIQRMQQPGYPAALQLQQTLEHAAQKSTAFDEKYKLTQGQIRGIVPSQQPSLISQAIQQQQQQAKSSSPFVSGFPTGSQSGQPGNYPPHTSSGGSHGRSNYPGQSQRSYY